MAARKKILFTVHHLHRLRVEPGFPREAVPALHVCPDGVLFKDSFIPFDSIASIETPAELQLDAEGLRDASVALSPGESCLVLRRVGGRAGDVVFLARGAVKLRERLEKAWLKSRHDLPVGWHRVRDRDYSLTCPDDWEPEETRHPNLRLRLFSTAEGVMLNLLVYEGEGSLDSIVGELVARHKERSDRTRVLSRKSVRVGDLQGQRLVLEEPGAEPPVITDTYLLMGPAQVIELQFLLPSEHYAKACGTLEKVAGGFRWRP